MGINSSTEEDLIARACLQTGLKQVRILVDTNIAGNCIVGEQGVASLCVVACYENAPSRFAVSSIRIPDLTALDRNSSFFVDPSFPNGASL